MCDARVDILKTGIAWMKRGLMLINNAPQSSYIAVYRDVTVFRRRTISPPPSTVSIFIASRLGVIVSKSRRMAIYGPAAN